MTSASDGQTTANRRCARLENGTVMWATPNTDVCKMKETVEKEITEMLEKTRDASGLSKEDVIEATKILIENIELASTSVKFAEQVLTIVSQIINMNESILQEVEEETSELVRAIEQFAEKIEINTNLTIATENIVVNAVDVPNNNTRATIFMAENVKFTLPTVEHSVCDSSSCGASRVVFVLYNKSSLFATRNDTQHGPLGRRKVVSCSLAGNATLVRPIQYELPRFQDTGRYKCVYWLAENRSWSSFGLTTNMTQTDDVITCYSNHLTGFSIILDPDPDVYIPEAHKLALSIISYIGCVVSIVGLLITIITYSIFKYLRKDNTVLILMNLCVSMLLLNTSYIMGTLKEHYGTSDVCIVVAVLLHYFVLTSLAWMTVEASHMFQLFIMVFSKYESYFMLKRSLAAWGLPLVIVVVTLAIDVSHYDSQDEYCRLSYVKPYVYYTVFLGPSCLLLLINTIMFILVSRIILNRSNTAISKSKQSKRSQMKTGVTAVQIRGTLTVMVLLGTTWLFGCFAIGPAKLPFDYVFCIFNSMQGFLIFIIRCIFYKDARTAWVNLFKTRSLARKQAQTIVSMSVTVTSGKLSQS